MKTILALETSCPVLSVALGTRQGGILGVRSSGTLEHSENLIPLVDRLLRKGRLKMDQIDAFAIDRGPGSFTGLRIGFGFLKGFLAVRKKPCYGAISLDMMTDTIRLPEGTRLGIFLDARREAVYARFYRRFEEGWKAEGKLELLSLSGLKTRIRRETVLTGNALVRYGKEIQRACGKRIHFLPHPDTQPSARTLVQWFQKQDPRISLLRTPHDWKPLYLRVSEAEENRRRRLKERVH